MQNICAKRHPVVGCRRFEQGGNADWSGVRAWEEFFMATCPQRHIRSELVSGRAVKYDAETLQERILTFRDQKVILDADLARIYGVATKVRMVGVDISFPVGGSCKTPCCARLKPGAARGFAKYNSSALNYRNAWHHPPRPCLPRQNHAGTKHDAGDSGSKASYRQP